jgi:hypothetical protein
MAGFEISMLHPAGPAGVFPETNSAECDVVLLPSLGRMEDLLLDMFVVACLYAASADSICCDTVGPQLMRGWIWNGVSVGAANGLPWLLLVSHHSDPAGATLSGPSSANVWGEGGP